MYNTLTSKTQNKLKIGKNINPFVLVQDLSEELEVKGLIRWIFFTFTHLLKHLTLRVIEI